MDAICQPLLRLPSPAAYIFRPRTLPIASSHFSCSRSHLQTPCQLRRRGFKNVSSDTRSLPSCVAGILEAFADGNGFIQRRHWHPNRRCKRSRGEINCSASVSQVSSSDWNGDLVASSVPTFQQRVRAFCFYVTTYIVAFPLFFIMLLIQPFVLFFDKHRRKAQHYINKIWASLTTYPFYKTDIEGLENLPGPNEPAVYVSNHQSYLDIYTLFLLGRPFKFISKTSNFLIPIIGWSMYLTGHVPLRRMDTRSQMECLKHCLNLVRQGVPVFFFPEGTRSRDGKMGQFKRGAFTIAAKTNVPIVPITLIGTGKLMPNGFEGTLRPGTVKVIIHPPIQGTNPDELCEQSRAVISKSLLQHGLGVH